MAVQQGAEHEETLQLEDNRSETIAQRKIQDAANNSPQVTQLKAIQAMANSSTQVKQLRAVQAIANESTYNPHQLKAINEEERVQGKFKPVQRKAEAPADPGENKTGLPHNLKSGVENLSGYSLDDVKVHYNSDKPAQLNALAYAQGTDIHVAGGQERHLPHEAWHVVQQKQGRVQATMQMKGKVNINDHEVAVANAPVQRQAWLIEKNDPRQEYPVLLLKEGAIQFLKDHGLTGINEDALNKLLDDPEKRNYTESKAGAVKLYNDIRNVAAIATCSFNFRYHNNQGKGALKYDPVSCAGKPPMDLEAIGNLRRMRVAEEEPKFDFVTALKPGSKANDRKIMIVPSVGCPEFLSNKQAVKQLQWAARAKDRPTVLFVPSVELKAYMGLQELLSELGVGLVAWRSEAGLLGFGASRLAAQQYAVFAKLSLRQEIVMCDVNVAASDDVAEGYDTGDEDDGTDRSIKAVKGKGKYSAAGFGTGVPLLNYDAEEGTLKKTKASTGGDTRPIEQVVIVGNIMLYDPSFITSSEDADLTNALLAQEEPFDDSVTSASFKYTKPGKDRDAAKENESKDNLEDKQPENVQIEKVDMDSASLSKSAYMHQRDELLERLAHEDHILIKYRHKEKEQVMTIGDLAMDIAKKYKLDKKVIRSLIIEKIILEAKRRERTQPGQGSGDSPGSTGPGMGKEPGFSTGSGSSTRRPLAASASTLMEDRLGDYGNVIDNGDLLNIGSTTYQVGAVTDNGDCLYATLISLGAAEGIVSVQALRNLIAEYEDAGNAFGDHDHAEGVRGNEYGTVDEDLEAHAELNGGIYVVHVFGHGRVGGELDFKQVGTRGPKYHILLQGAHFRPLKEI